MMNKIGGVEKNILYSVKCICSLNIVSGHKHSSMNVQGTISLCDSPLDGPSAPKNIGTTRQVKRENLKQTTSESKNNCVSSSCPISLSCQIVLRPSSQRTDTSFLRNSSDMQFVCAMSTAQSESCESHNGRFKLSTANFTMVGFFPCKFWHAPVSLGKGLIFLHIS